MSYNITIQVRKNTYQKGTLNFILYPTGEGTFVAACNELCIIKEGKDAELVKLQALAASKSYLLNVIKHKLGEHLLNQSLPKEIMAEFNTYRLKKKMKTIRNGRRILRVLSRKNV